MLKAADFGEVLSGVADGDSFEQSVRRAIGKSARLASALFAEMALNGQVDLLTTTSFDRPQDLFSGSGALPRGVAYLSLASPVVGGEWRMRGSMTQGDLASWIIAGSYGRRAAAAHRYEAGISYGMQRYQGGNAEALAAIRDGARNVGAIYAYDDWTLNPRLSVAYGAEYASYDYLGDPRLVSPRASVTVQPFDGENLTVRVARSHRETAPGAEEFAPSAHGLWLPPERTFSSASRRAIRPQRLDHTELALERDLAGRPRNRCPSLPPAYRRSDRHDLRHGDPPTAARRSATTWSARRETSRRAAGRSVPAAASAPAPAPRSTLGQVDAERVGRSADARTLARLAPSTLRDSERIHDLTATIESVVAATSTRVFFVYKVSTGYATARAAEAIAARFDLQVRQALPFLNFSGAQVEMLIAVRNLFREDPLDGSVYDELLVVRPPTRVLGGVTVRF